MTKHTEILEMVDIDKLIPYVNNARTHSDDQIKKIQSSLREFGFVNPVLIDKELGIIAGHGRVEAAKRNGRIPDSGTKESIYFGGQSVGRRC